MALSGRTALVAALSALIVGLLLPSWLGILSVEILLLLAIVYDIARAAPVRNLRITRSGDTSVRLGQEATVHLTVGNPSTRPLRARLRDAWPPSSWVSGTEIDASRHTLTLPPGEYHRLSTTLRPTRRGDRHAERITVRSLGPLGLAGRQGSHEVPWRVRVLPPFDSRQHLPAKLARLRDLDGRTSALIRGAGTEFDSLRDYLPGDDTRSIDWRATARQSTVAVRTWRPERDRHLLVILDTGRTSAGRVGDVPRLDAAMDAALLLAVLASRAGDRVDLLAYDRSVRATVQHRATPDALAALVDAMATLEPALIESDIRGLASTALRIASNRSILVLFTGLDSSVLDSGLLHVLPLLTQRHTVLVAAVADPHLDDMAAARGSIDSVYSAAAAAHTKSEREDIADRLRHHGVTVIDATPTALPPALADAYLALKSAGRL